MMKKFISLILSLTLAAALSACGGQSDPKALAVEFAEALAAGDFDKSNSMLSETNPDDFKPEKEMSALEKAYLEQIRENTKKMKYRFSIDESLTEIEDDYATVHLIITSETDSEFKVSPNVDFSKNSETGKWEVTNYSRHLNKLIGF